MVALGRPVKDLELKDLIAYNNLDIDGFIDFSDFLELQCHLYSTDDSE
jgi:hypothetical protein